MEYYAQIVQITHPITRVIIEFHEMEHYANDTAPRHRYRRYMNTANDNVSLYASTYEIRQIHM